MKLILNCLILFDKFFPDFMLPLLHRGYCIEFIVFWERIGGAGNAMKATARWVGFGLRQGFPGRDRVFWFCVGTGVPFVVTWFSSYMQLLCRDIVFHVATVFCFSVGTMSR